MNYTPKFYLNKGPEQFLSIRPVDYGIVEREAHDLMKNHKVSFKKNKIAIVLIDFQVKFSKSCQDETNRVCKFIYNRMERISDIFIFSKSHLSCNIVSPFFWNGVKSGEVVTVDKIDNGLVKVRESIYEMIPSYKQGALDTIVRHVIEKSGGIKVKEQDTMFCGVGAATIPALEECVFYHSCLSGRQPFYENYGIFPLSEYKSVFSPIVKEGPNGTPFFVTKYSIVDHLSTYENIIFVGSCINNVLHSAFDAIEHNRDILSKLFIFSDCCAGKIKDFNGRNENVILNNMVSSNEWENNKIY